MNIFENFILRQTIACNDKDPPWMNKQIKTLIAEKNAFYKYLERRTINSKFLDKIDGLQAKLQSPINILQFKYYRKISKKLSDPSTSSKCYWTLLKTLLNGIK